jgi:IclR family acetate operon transcriptional repressor
MRAVSMALRVMEGVARYQPIGASELARRLALSKTTVHRSLMSLVSTGWIERAHKESSTWTLSMHALVVGGHAVESLGGLRSIAIPVMEELRRATEETIHLLVRYRDTVVLIERLDGIKPVRVFNPLGGRARLHRTSSGKAILAHLPVDEIAAYLKHAPVGESAGKLDIKALTTELAQVKKRGFAVNRGENQTGVSAVGAAIVDNEGFPLAAITISMPSERMPVERVAARGALVKDAARRISLGLRLR